MTIPQIEAFAIIGVMLGLFVSDRLRYDLVAALALSCAALTCIVPRQRVFEGFANPVIIIIASVLVLGRAIAVSGVIEASIRPLLTRLKTTSLQVGALAACVTFLSAFMKNVGTLGIFMPIAIQTAERAKRPASRYLMPLAFGSLVGGTITQIGTSPNLLISAVRQETQGRPFTLFDFTPVGLPLSIMAVLFLAFGWRLIPKGRRAQAGERRFEIEAYTSEVRLPAGSPLENKTVGELEALGDGSVVLSAIIREGHGRYVPGRHWTLYANDVLMLQGDPVALTPVIQAGGLELAGAAELPQTASKDGELEAAEAVITEGSLLVGQTLETLSLRQRFEVNVLAVGRRGQRIRDRLRKTRLQVGDTVVVQGRHNALTDVLVQLGCLPLAERHLVLGQRRTRLLPVGILVAALVAIPMGLASAEVAFFVAAVAVVLFRVLTPKQAYDAIDWPIIVMLGCLIPVGEALKDTGAAALMGNALTVVAAHLPGPYAVAFILLASMLVTPFLHHAAAVLVMGPVAATVAGNLGYAPDAFLMAVALGASCDFLTPVGHQNNLLVMAPGGYRFSDYWRLGLPLSCLIVVVGTLLIVHAWPLH
ncbi:MAG: SLC13 family permease [Acetobacteraceae bacterium]